MTRYDRCPACVREQQAIALRERRRTQQKYLDNVKTANLRRYGISVADYEAMRQEQDYRCAICGRSESELPARGGGRPRKDGLAPASSAKLVVDHCHEDGRVRGLLCGSCNFGLGNFADDPDRLRAAADWLDRVNGQGG